MVAHPAGKADTDRCSGRARETRYRPSPVRKAAGFEATAARRGPTEGRLALFLAGGGEGTSGFGPRNGSFHDGVDIAAPRGTAVLAAADGQVIFSDVLRGYGNVVIVRHTGGYVTLYAHNQVNSVQEGQL